MAGWRLRHLRLTLTLVAGRHWQYFRLNLYPCSGTALSQLTAFETYTYSCGGMALAAFEGNPYPCGGMALAAFETNTYSCGWTALGEFAFTGL